MSDLERAPRKFLRFGGLVAELKKEPVASEATRKILETMPLNYLKIHFRIFLQSPSCTRLTSCTICYVLLIAFINLKPRGPWPIIHG